MMKPLPCMVLWAAFASCAVADDAVVQKELERLRGTWRFWRLETASDSEAIRSYWEGDSLTIDGEKAIGPKDTGSQDFRIDVRPLAEPATIEFVPADGKPDGKPGRWPMLYRLEGDTLKLSYLLDASLPKRFEGGIIVVFVRTRP